LNEDCRVHANHAVEEASFRGFCHLVAVHQRHGGRLKSTVVLGAYKDRVDAVCALANHLATDEYEYLSPQAWTNLTGVPIIVKEEVTGELRCLGHDVLMKFYEHKIRPKIFDSKTAKIKDAAVKITGLFRNLFCLINDGSAFELSVTYLRVDTSKDWTDEFLGM
jgi:hypothetical protein